MTAFVGDILSATAAPVSAAPASSTTWSWLRNGATIPAATSTTYRVTVNDSGASIQALQSETNFLGSASTASNALTISPWTPSALFTANEPGAWYDPSDLSTMFQDRAGTTPVTAPGQSVGLRLDKSQGLVLGPELVTNGDFSAGSTGWTLGAGWSVTGGAAVRDSTVGASNLSGGAGVEIGKTYRITWTQTGSSFVAVYLGSVLGPLVSNTNVAGTYSATVAATVTGGIVFRSGAAVSGIDNISVKELPGNHAVAIADASRGTYGIEPFGGRRNLLTFTEQFENAAWVKQTSNISANSIVAPNGEVTADTARLNAGASLTTSALGLFTNSAIYVSTPTTSALTVASYTFSLYVKGGAGLSHVQLRTSTVAALNPALGSTLIRLSDGVVIDGPGVVTDAGNGWWRVSLTYTATAAVNHFGVWFWNSSSIPSAAGTEGVYIWGAQLEVGSTATNYQRVGTAFDVTEAGVPTVHYVQFDGADDGYVTPTITPGTDKAQVFAGVRKLSDAATGVIVESSANPDTSNGVFSLANVATTGALFWRSKGTLTQDITTSPTLSPVTRIHTGIGDIAGDRATLRINGTQVAQNTGDQGTGNYLAYPLYIGRRGGTTLPFNGRDYGLVVRFGANLSTSEINRAEYYMAQRTGVTL